MTGGGEASAVTDQAIGISATTRVPPPAGLSTVRRPPRAATRSCRPRMPDPLSRSAPPTPSSPTSTMEDRASARSVDADSRRRRVLGHVGQRLGDDEIGRGLDRRRQAPVRDGGDVGGHGRSVGQGHDRGAESGFRQDRRVDATSELPELPDRDPEFGRRVVRGGDRFVIRRHRADQGGIAAVAGRGRARRDAAAHRREGRARAGDAPRRSPRRSSPETGGPRPRPPVGP